MNKSNEENKKFDNILTSVLVVNLILIIMSEPLYLPNIVQFINYCMAFLISFIVMPINEYMKKGILKDKSVISRLIIRVSIILIFILSFYKILLSKNYSLRCIYWICLGSSALMILSIFIEVLTKNYRERKSSGKRYNKLYTIGYFLIVVLIGSIQVYSLISYYTYPPRHLSLDNIKIPEKIVIYEDDTNKSKESPIDFGRKTEITSLEDLEKITGELKSIGIESIRSTDLLNYERMRDDNYPHYSMLFDYGDLNSRKNRLEDGYIDSIILTSNGNISIRQLSNKENLIFGRKFYNEVFPISLSEETLDIIATYLE